MSKRAAAEVLERRVHWWFDRAILTIVAVVPLLGVLLAARMAWQRGGIGATNLILFGAFWAATMFGIEGGYHRYFSHRSFRAGPVFEAVLVILGSMAFQGPAVWWAALHRRHHKSSDRAGDPHSPRLHGVGVRAMLVGLWDAHMGWNVREFETIRDKSTWKHLVPDLLENQRLRSVNRGYFVWLALGLALPAVIGGALAESWRGAFEGFLWGGLVRLFAVTQGIYLVNSIGHAFGSRPFSLYARDRATNNGLVALLTLGAGFHHNHHLFPTSATTQVEPWQIDVVGWVLRGLAALGVVKDLRMPPADVRSARWKRQGTVQIRGSAGQARGARLCGLSPRGAFIESRRAPDIFAVGARVQLQHFMVDLDSMPIPATDAVVEYACWQGIGVRFVDATDEFSAAIASIRRKTTGPLDTPLNGSESTATVGLEHVGE